LKVEGCSDSTHSLSCHLTITVERNEEAHLPGVSALEMNFTTAGALAAKMRSAKNISFYRRVHTNSEISDSWTDDVNPLPIPSFNMEMN
jgi:hypothetical protein